MRQVEKRVNYLGIITLLMERKLEVRVYSAKSGHNGLLPLFKDMLADFWKSRDFGYSIAKRDIQGMYRRSVLGIFWAFITPLFTALVWIFLNGSGVVKVDHTPIPYPAYVFSGTLLWSIFSESIMAPITQTQQSRSVMTKINFPKEGLLIAAFYKVLLNSGIKFILMVGLFLLLGVYPDAKILWVPLLIVALIFLGFVIGIISTPISLLYGDVSRAIPLVLQLLMFLCPIVYLMPADGIMQKLMLLNPVTPIVSTVRNFMTGADFFMPGYFALIMGLTLVMGVVGWVFYRLSMPLILER